MILIKISNSVKRFFKNIYVQLFKIDDTTQRIAFGLGLGVFLGLLPGTGPIAALFCSVFLRVNRAATLLGALITNTWLSIVTFLLAIKVGSAITGVNWQTIRQELILLLKDFHWEKLFNLSVIKIISPLLIGYIIIGLSLGILVYCAVVIIAALRRK